MNKLEVSTEELGKNLECLELQNKIYRITNQTKIKELKITKETKEVQIILEKDASLTVGTILEIEDINTKIQIYSKESSSLLLQLGIHAKGKNVLTIENNMEENNCKNTIKVRMVGEENSHTTLKTVGSIKKNTFENEFTEDIKYLSEKTSFIECLPELLVSSKNTTANHFLSIGTIKEEDLFFLEAKGIEKEKAKSLIRECFIKSMIIREEE